MEIIRNQPLAPLTTFGTGGQAQFFYNPNSKEELVDKISELKKPLWFLGYGSNVLISDKGLPGTVLKLAFNKIGMTEENDSWIFTADAGASWDSLVRQSLNHNASGIELMSGIPGGIGGAVAGNIAAYGQAVSDTLLWVEVIDTNDASAKIIRLDKEQLGLTYRNSDFQNNKLTGCVILNACFKLSKSNKKNLEYSSALKVADELCLDPQSLHDRRKIIMEARKRAGSLLEDNGKIIKTAGSFFKNPIVEEAVAKEIIKQEENNKDLAKVIAQNKIHGGNSTRVSAAHVLLAAGFKRGQSWGPVRLHPEHVLKIENTGGASSQQIYDVAQEIMQRVKEILNISLEPEVKFLGEFIK